jgi:DNA oxidative demethylase
MRHEHLAPGAMVLRQFAAPEEAALLAGIEGVTVHAPFRHMITPGGFRMSVGMTNCGPLGWVTDKTGYRYDAVDPVSGLPWPPMPDVFRRLATGAAANAGFNEYVPDACLVNRYEPGSRLTLHTHGDVVVWGGPSRLRYHGVLPLKEGRHPLVGVYRINLTFRKAG